MRSSDIHIRTISLDIPQPSITEIICKIKYLKFHSNFPGANELKMPRCAVSLYGSHLIYSTISIIEKRRSNVHHNGTSHNSSTSFTWHQALGLQPPYNVYIPMGTECWVFICMRRWMISRHAPWDWQHTLHRWRNLIRNKGKSISSMYIRSAKSVPHICTFLRTMDLNHTGKHNVAAMKSTLAEGHAFQFFGNVKF